MSDPGTLTGFPGATEIMDLRKEFITSGFLDQFNFLLRHKSHPYTSRISVIVIPFQVSIFCSK